MSMFKATLSSGKEIIVNSLDMVYAVSELNQQGYRYDVAKIERWSQKQQKEAREKKERKSDELRERN